jgi:hypothetical protein
MAGDQTDFGGSLRFPCYKSDCPGFAVLHRWPSSHASRERSEEETNFDSPHFRHVERIINRRSIRTRNRVNAGTKESVAEFHPCLEENTMKSVSGGSKRQVPPNVRKKQKKAMLSAFGFRSRITESPDGLRKCRDENGARPFPPGYERTRTVVRTLPNSPSVDGSRL